MEYTFQRILSHRIFKNQMSHWFLVHLVNGIPQLSLFHTSWEKLMIFEYIIAS